MQNPLDDFDPQEIFEEDWAKAVGDEDNPESQFVYTQTDSTNPHTVGENLGKFLSDGTKTHPEYFISYLTWLMAAVESEQHPPEPNMAGECALATLVLQTLAAIALQEGQPEEIRVVAHNFLHRFIHFIRLTTLSPEIYHDRLAALWRDLWEGSHAES